MTNSRPRPIASLEDVTAEYDAVFCDVWGVVHDGVAKFAAAEEALVRFRATGRKVVLVNHPNRYDGQTPPLRIKGLEIGEHTRDILREHGYTDAQISDFLARGIVGTPGVTPPVKAAAEASI